MSLHREIVIQEYFSLQRYPLMISRERYEFYFIIVEIIRSLPLGFFTSHRWVLHVKSCLFSLLLILMQLISLHLSLNTLRDLECYFQQSLYLIFLSSRWSSTTSIRKSWIRAQTIKQ